MYELNRLRMLRELQQRGTIRAVAAALHYSPSTVSQQLSVLETEAGVPLLQSAGRQVRFTPQGEILAAHAGVVLRELEAAQAELARSVQEVTGTLRIAGFQSVLWELLPAAMTELSARHPQLRIEVLQAEPEQAIPLLLGHQLDLVLCEDYPGQALPQPAQVQYRELFAERMLLAVPAADAPHDAHGWDAVRDSAWAAEPEGAASRRWMTQLCRRAGFEPDVRFRSDDLLVHRRLVAAGHAVALLPEMIAQDDPAVRYLDVPGGPEQRRVLTVNHASMSRHPALLACRSALLNARAVSP